MRFTLLAACTGLLLTGAAVAAETVTYTYDARGRLVEVNHAGGPAAGHKIQYEYDDADNVKRKRVTGA
jgi:YD repeat-containing protein